MQVTEQRKVPHSMIHARRSWVSWPAITRRWTGNFDVRDGQDTLLETTPACTWAPPMLRQTPKILLSIVLVLNMTSWRLD